MEQALSRVSQCVHLIFGHNGIREFEMTLEYLIQNISLRLKHIAVLTFVKFAT